MARADDRRPTYRDAGSCGADRSAAIPTVLVSDVLLSKPGRWVEYGALILGLDAPPSPNS